MVGLLNYPKEYRSFGLTNKKISVDPGFLDEHLSCGNTWDQEGFSLLCKSLCGIHFRFF